MPRGTWAVCARVQTSWLTSFVRYVITSDVSPGLRLRQLLALGGVQHELERKDGSLPCRGRNDDCTGAGINSNISSQLHGRTIGASSERKDPSASNACKAMRHARVHTF